MRGQSCVTRPSDWKARDLAAAALFLRRLAFFGWFSCLEIHLFAQPILAGCGSIEVDPLGDLRGLPLRGNAWPARLAALLCLFRPSLPRVCVSNALETPPHAEHLVVGVHPFCATGSQGRPWPKFETRCCIPAPLAALCESQAWGRKLTRLRHHSRAPRFRQDTSPSCTWFCFAHDPRRSPNRESPSNSLTHSRDGRCTVRDRGRWVHHARRGLQ